ncbi:MAG: carboxylate--amine ligase [Alphaproteobacteria bacterium]|nr:carboxylate--amine ligase [Alphaproteobacteria bacterium]
MVHAYMNVATALTPAVVIGGELNGLGVCRSLAKSGIPIYVLDAHRRNPAMWSRYVKAIKVPALHGEPLLTSLQTLHRKVGGNPVIIFTDEMALLTISKYRDQLSGMYRFRLPGHAAVMMLHDKVQFHEFAVANDFPVPNAVIVRHENDLAGIRQLRFPVIIKPADKRVVHLGAGFRLSTAHDFESATRLSRQLLKAAECIIVQECVEGPDTSIFFCLFYRAKGKTLAMFTGRKLASTPPGTGSTAYCTEAGSLAPLLARDTEALMERVEYEGIGSVEYKWDSRSERFVIIEPTVGRTDWQEEVATLCGVNIPLAAYRDECDLPPIPAQALPPIVWQSSLVERVKAGALAANIGLRTVDGYWRAADPLPAFVSYPRDFVISAPSMVRAIAGRIGQRLAGPFGRLSERGEIGGPKGLPSGSDRAIGTGA